MRHDEDVARAQARGVCDADPAGSGERGRGVVLARFGDGQCWAAIMLGGSLIGLGRARRRRGRWGGVLSVRVTWGMIR